MSIQVALHHVTRYRYDRPVGLSPHEVRLRPAPHCRTPILSYSLTVAPAKHFVNWQQDIFSNWIARFVFPEKARELEITVDLVADMTVVNPFDFFVESYADRFPFAYPADLGRDLVPFLATEPAGPRLAAWIAAARGELLAGEIGTADFLVALNLRLQRDVRYLVRLEPGVQTCEETLGNASGSCRDTGWLLVQILRHLGLAARFVSGYLVQLTADVKSLDGPSGTERDFTDLHAWAEVYLPGAGWVGLDPTSGLLAGEGHIPLACTPFPGSAAAVIGYTDATDSHFEFEMKVTRIHEDPRVTKPYTPGQWAAAQALGAQVDAELEAGDVRLTMGGEPTFVSIDDMDGPEWNYAAHGPAKRALSEQLLLRLKARFAPGGVLHYGQGKWYPGEPLPRWALGVFWRRDGVPVWRDERLLAATAPATPVGAADAQRLAEALCAELNVPADFLVPAHEDAVLAAHAASRKPAGKAAVASADAVAGYMLPLKPAPRPDPAAPTAWRTSRWPLRNARLELIPGDSPLGFRLPLDSLPKPDPEDEKQEFPRDPFADAGALPDPHGRATAPPAATVFPRPIRTALCVEPREGFLQVFLPPVTLAEDWVELVTAVERAAAKAQLAVRLEGYEPPADTRLRLLKITPDPGVIEVNVHPSGNWKEIVANTVALYEEARLARLGTEKFMLDGRHTGTGGGNHVTLGGATPTDSPMLRRPDVLKSLITYWQNHPALSYLFSGQFIGPTSQAPRVDEARDDNLYELEIAFQQMALKQQAGEESLTPWLVDRLLRNLLIDLTGNTHRAEFCIDKLYSPDTPTGRLGIVELRAFEMPPHAQMSLVQQLLLRSLVARFWKTPSPGRLIRWGTQLHDRFMLPHFVAADMRDVARDLVAAGYPFDFEWFAPFIEFRFPRYGTVVYENISLELRQAIEPWHVLGEEVTRGATARYVDSSVERLQIKVNGMTDTRHLVCCNGRPVPLHPTGVTGEFVAGVRYRAWNPPSALHPSIEVQAPLVLDIVDTWSARAIGGCTYHVSHPGGRNYDTFPVNANEAEARRLARFWSHGHTPGPMTVKVEPLNPDFPYTLDLRWQPE